MPWKAVTELTEADNFHTSIYEDEWDGLLLARCNQNGTYPQHGQLIVDALNGKRDGAKIIEDLMVENARLKLRLAGINVAS